MIRLCNGMALRGGPRFVAMPSPCSSFSSRRPLRLPSRTRGISRVASSTVQRKVEEPGSKGALRQLSLRALPALVLTSAKSLSPLQVGVITACGLVLAALARARAARCLMVVSTSRRALAGLPFPPSALGPWVREDVFVMGAGLALFFCWALWRVLRQRIVYTPLTRGAPEQPPALPPPANSSNGEGEQVRRLQFQLQQARQEASEAKHRLKALQQAWQESGGGGSGSGSGSNSDGSQGPPRPGQRSSSGVELARAESKAGEARVARMEAQEAKEELAVMRQEVQELSNIVTATLEGISSDSGDEEGAAQGSKRPAEVATGNGSNGDGGGSRLLAAATALQSKVALLKQRAETATALLEEKRRLQDKLREADVAVASLTHDISTLKWEAQHAHYTIDSLQIHLQSSQKENRGLRAAAAKAERHLDAYDQMVLRLEDQCEALEGEREQLRARLVALRGEGAAGSAGGSASAGQRGRGDSQAAWGLNGAGNVGVGSAAS